MAAAAEQVMCGAAGRADNMLMQQTAAGHAGLVPTHRAARVSSSLSYAATTRASIASFLPGVLRLDLEGMEALRWEPEGPPARGKLHTQGGKNGAGE